MDSFCAFEPSKAWKGEDLWVHPSGHATFPYLWVHPSGHATFAYL